MTRIFIVLLAAVSLLFTTTPAHAAEPDVVVYGGTAGGAIAAIAAAEQGLSVLLLEPGEHIGGMVSGGLGRTDYGNSKVIGGMARTSICGWASITAKTSRGSRSRRWRSRCCATGWTRRAWPSASTRALIP